MNASRDDDRFQGTEEPGPAAAGGPIVQDDTDDTDDADDADVLILTPETAEAAPTAEDDADVLILEVDEVTPDTGRESEAAAEAGVPEAAAPDSVTPETAAPEAGPAAGNDPDAPILAPDEATFTPVPLAGTVPAAETIPDVAPVGVTPGMPLASSSPARNPDQRWRDIQSMFVDDPRGSVERAADLAAETVRGLVTALQERERSLKSSWQGADTDTEKLRNSLRSYRDLVDRVDEFSRQS